MSQAVSELHFLKSARTGVVAGVIGSTIQVTVGLLIDKFLLPREHDNNIAPRFITRIFQKKGDPPNLVRDWTLGTLFHFGYGVGWGSLFGLVRRWSGISSPLIGGAMGLLIYLLAFSRIGAGTKTGTEVHPGRRDWRKQLSLLAVAWTYSMSTAVIYDRLARRS
jgi:hypothetical protein